MVFRVANPGPPIPPADQARLFERFARGPSARPGGLGLGLPIARAFTRMLGGDLRLESSDATGTVFTISLPAAPASPPAPSSPAFPAPSAPPAP